MNSTDVDRARAALAAIDPGCPREEWVRVGMAAKAAGLGLDDFLRWSESGANFAGESDCRTVWRSFSDTGGITAGTLFAAAQDAGWRPAQLNGHRESARPAAARARPPATEKPSPSSSAVFDAWSTAKPATAEHGYVARKLGLPEGLRIYHGPARISGTSIDGFLLMPAYRLDGTLATWQAIPPGSGKKLNCPGRRFDGAWFTVGAFNGATRVYVCEGLGQAWSAHQATRQPAVAAFGAARQEEVARAIRSAYPGVPVVLVADVGKEGNIERAAQAIRCGWIAPAADLGDNGDINDLHQRDGLQAVAELLAQAKIPAGVEPALTAKSLQAFLAESSVVEFLADDLFVKGYVYSLTGLTGAGKTAVAAPMTLCAAAGLAIGKHRFQAGPVLYVAGENPADVRNRFAVAVEQMQVSAEALARVHVIDRSFLLAACADELRAIIEQVGAVMVVFDTDQAVSLAPGAEEKDNGERLEHAKLLRSLTRCASRPVVLDLCHPTKRATRDDLTPRGGSAFLNEVDGNLCLWRDGDQAELFSDPNKFRGSPLSLSFTKELIESDLILDAKGRRVPVPFYRLVAPDEADQQRQQTWRDENRLVYEMAQSPLASQADWAKACAWVSDDGTPRKDKVNRLLNRLAEEKPPLVKQARSGRWALTPAGKKEAEKP